MSMTATEILVELERRGVELIAAGDRLRFRPREAVSRELVEALARHKAEILAAVQSGQPATSQCPGPEKCAGCYSIGVLDGRERFIHRPKGKPVDWTGWKPATEKIQ